MEFWNAQKTEAIPKYGIADKNECKCILKCVGLEDIQIYAGST